MTHSPLSRPILSYPMLSLPALHCHVTAQLGGEEGVGADPWTLLPSQLHLEILQVPYCTLLYCTPHCYSHPFICLSVCLSVCLSALLSSLPSEHDRTHCHLIDPSSSLYHSSISSNAPLHSLIVSFSLELSLHPSILPLSNICDSTHSLNSLPSPVIYMHQS
jgi:hypothetical protein